MRAFLIVNPEMKIIVREEEVSEGHLEEVYGGLFTAQNIC